MPKQHIFIIGPGGVGKTTSGKLLAEILIVPFIDLDIEFINRIDNIGSYIKDHGYEKYCYLNSKLFLKLLEEATNPSLFVLSSGFLVHEGLEDLTEKNRKVLKEKGISILLLPSKSLKESTEIVVKRQLLRGFGLIEEKEQKKFINRYGLYHVEGDLKIFSHDSPKNIANEMLSGLKSLNHI